MNEFMKTFRSYFHVLGFISLFIVGIGLIIILNISDFEASANALEVFTAGVEGLDESIPPEWVWKYQKVYMIQDLTDKGISTKSYKQKQKISIFCSIV